MINLGQRIKALREVRRLSQADLARLCGWETKSRIGNYEQGTREPNLSDMEHIAKAFGMTLQELMFGNENTGASAGGKVTWQGKEDLPQDSYVLIPRYEIDLSAGCDSISWVTHDKDPLPLNVSSIQAKGLNPNNLRALNVTSDRMEPYLLKGDTAVIDVEDTKPKDGLVYAVCYESEWHFMRIFKVPGGKLVLHSDNSRFREIEVAPESGDSIRIFGRVVWRAG